MPTTIPTTRTAHMLVRDATNETLREAHPFEVAQIAATRFGAMALDLRGGPVVCRIETREGALTDAEYNALLDEIECTESRRPSRRARARRTR